MPSDLYYWSYHPWNQECDGFSVYREKLEVVWQTVAMRDRQNCGNTAHSLKTGNVQGRGWVEIWVLCVVIIMLISTRRYTTIMNGNQLLILLRRM